MSNAFQGLEQELSIIQNLIPTLLSVKGAKLQDISPEECRADAQLLTPYSQNKMNQFFYSVMLYLLILAAAFLQLTVIIILFVRVFFQQAFFDSQLNDKFFIYPILTLMVEIASCVIYLSNKKDQPRNWRNRFYLYFVIINPWFYQQKLHLYRWISTLCTKKNIITTSKDFPQAIRNMTLIQWYKALKIIIFLIVNSPVVIVPIVLGIQSHNFVALQIFAMLMLMAIVYKQLILFLSVSIVGSRPIFRKIFILFYFFLTSTFILVWLTRMFQIILMDNGYQSPNQQAATCYTDNDQNCTWVQNMLFLVNLASGFVTANPIPSEKNATIPGFLIQVIGSTILFLIGLFINLIVIGYIISIMLSYFDQLSKKRANQSFLSQITLALQADQFSRCLLLDRFRKYANDSFLIRNFQSQFKKNLLVSLADPQFEQFINQNMINPYKDWLRYKKMLLLRKTNFYRTYQPQNFSVNLRKTISPFQHSQLAPQPIISTKPSRFFKCKMYQKELVQLFQFAVLEGSLLIFQDKNIINDYVLYDNYFITYKGTAYLAHPDYQPFSLSQYLDKCKFQQGKGIPFGIQAKKFNNHRIYSTRTILDQSRFSKAIILIARKRDIDKYFKKNSRIDPLQYCSIHKRYDIPTEQQLMKIIQISQDLTHIPNYQTSALHIATALNNQQLIQTLLKKQINWSLFTDFLGNSLLHLAVFSKNHKLVQLMLQYIHPSTRNNIDINSGQAAVAINDSTSLRLILNKVNDQTELQNICVSIINSAFYFERQVILCIILQQYYRKNLVYVSEQVGYYRIKLGQIFIIGKQKRKQIKISKRLKGLVKLYNKKVIRWNEQKQIF